jgi:hypothetical protein
MCKNAESQVLNIAKVSESTIVSLLTQANLISTSQGQTIQTDFTAAITAIENWKSGTPATEILEIVQGIMSNLQLIPIPAPFNLLVPAALAGLETILGLLGANESTASTTDAPASAAQAHVIAAASQQQVAKLTGYKVSMFDRGRAVLGDNHVAADKYKGVWNGVVEKNSLPETLKVA